MHYYEIDKIKLGRNNPRTVKDVNFMRLVKSIKKFPKMLEKRPVVCFTNEYGEIEALGGNQRLKAGKEAGLKTIPIELADDWTPEERAEFIIKDNVSAGEWDWEALKIDWPTDQLKDWGIKGMFDKPAAPEDKPKHKKELQGVIVDFKPEDYAEAAALIQELKTAGVYLGGIFLEAMKHKKAE